MDKTDQETAQAGAARQDADFLAGMRGDLLAFCLSRVKQRELAEDIVQESCIRFLKASRAAVIDNPRGYLYRIAFNLTVSHFRHQKIRVIAPDGEIDAEKTPGTEVSPEEWLRYKQFRDRFNGLFAELSATQQTIFYLRRMEGLTTAEIALKQGISRRMVQKYMAQIIKFFHQGLAETTMGDNELT